MKRTNRCDRMSNSRFMSPSLKDHALPEGTIEIAGKLRCAILDEEVERVLLLSVFAPWYVDGVCSNTSEQRAYD